MNVADTFNVSDLIKIMIEHEFHVSFEKNKYATAKKVYLQITGKKRIKKNHKHVQMLVKSFDLNINGFKEQYFASING